MCSSDLNWTFYAMYEDYASTLMGLSEQENWVALPHKLLQEIGHLYEALHTYPFGQNISTPLLSANKNYASDLLTLGLMEILD